MLSDWCVCVVGQNHKSRSFQIGIGISPKFVLSFVLFSHFINDLSALLSFFFSCFLLADDLMT